jgi:hypothetical protein
MPISFYPWPKGVMGMDRHPENAWGSRTLWTGTVFAVLFLACPGMGWAQCTEKVASFDLVQTAEGDIIIPVLLQDTQTKMGMDFSFTWTSLKATTAEKLGIPIRKILTKRNYHASGVDITQFLDVPIKLGAMSKRMEMMALPEGAQIDPQMDGWLGLNVLTTFDIDIDFGNTKLNLFQPGYCHDEKMVYWTKDYDVLPLTVRKFGNIDFPAQLDGHDVQMNLDVFDPLGTVKTSAGPFDLAAGEDHRSFSSLKIGKQDVKNVSMHVMDDRENPCQPRFQCFGAEAGGLVSLNQLKGLHLYFAYHTKKLYVSAANAR